MSENKRPKDEYTSDEDLINLSEAMIKLLHNEEESNRLIEQLKIMQTPRNNTYEPILFTDKELKVWNELKSEVSVWAISRLRNRFHGCRECVYYSYSKCEVFKKTIQMTLFNECTKCPMWRKV